MSGNAPSGGKSAVKGETGSLNALALEADIRKKIIDRAVKTIDGAAPGDIKVEIKNKKILENLPKEAVTYTFDLDHITAMLGVTNIPLVLFNAKGAEIGKRLVIFETTAYGNLIKTVTVIPAEQAIKKEDIEMVYTELNGKPYQKSIKRPENVIGKEPISTLAKDTFITEWMIRKVPTVRQGDKVSVVVSGRNIQVRFKGVVLDDGAVGDNVRIRSLTEANKIMEGKVVNSQVVKIAIVD